MDTSTNEGGSAFYEIFVGSYCDSNNDGVGDLNGITSKLDYLQNLGVSYLWLTPVHPSPTYHKYDVKDYYAIDSSFGTLEDFKTLVSSAKSHHIGIVMDMLDNSANYYYGFLFGRINYTNYAAAGGSTPVGMGSGTYSIVYSSQGRTGNITVGTDYKFTGLQNEFLLLKNF